MDRNEFLFTMELLERIRHEKKTDTMKETFIAKTETTSDPA